MAQKIVTKEIYNKIKAIVKQPKDDVVAMKKFGFGRSTIQSIRNTDDYQAYCERRFRFHGNPNKKAKIARKEVKVDKDTEAELDELIKGAMLGNNALQVRAASLPLTSITINGGFIHINTI